MQFLRLDHLDNCTFSGNSASVNGGGLFTTGAHLAHRLHLQRQLRLGQWRRLDVHFLRHDRALRLHRQRQYRQLRRRRHVQLLGHLVSEQHQVIGNSAFRRRWSDTDYGTTMLTDCTVSGNFASGNGGGLTPTLARPSDQLRRQRELRTDGGGVNTDNIGTTTLTNCTVSGNSASASGGGLYVKRRHDEVDELHRQRQLRWPTAAAFTTVMAP